MHRTPLLLSFSLLAACQTPRVEAPSPVCVVQRTSEPVPGSGGQLRLEAGDVTGGQVLVRIVDEAGNVVLPQRSMRPGDTATFDWKGRQDTIGLVRLVNFLIGDDFAEFYVGTPTGVARSQIEAMLRRIETSDGKFIRNGKVYDGKSAAAHLRMKYEMAGGRIGSASEFLEHVATKSSLTGEPYEVQFGGDPMPLAEWLRQDLSRPPPGGDRVPREE